jgi:hypothetical protein
LDGLTIIGVPGRQDGHPDRRPGKPAGRGRGRRPVLPARPEGPAGIDQRIGGRRLGSRRQATRGVAFTVANGRIGAIELVTDSDRLAQLDLTILAENPD